MGSVSLLGQHHLQGQCLTCMQSGAEIAHVQIRAPHRSKSEVEEVLAESAAWQELMVENGKGPGRDTHEASSDASALGELLAHYSTCEVVFHVNDPAR